MTPHAETEINQLPIDRLKRLGREALEQAHQAAQRANEARSASASRAQSARDCERQAFSAQMAAGRCQAKNDEKGAEQQKKVSAHLREKAAQLYAEADANGEQAAMFEREAYRQQTLAHRLVDEIRARSQPDS